MFKGKESNVIFTTEACRDIFYNSEWSFKLYLGKSAAPFEM